MKSILEIKNEFLELGENLNLDWYFLETKDKIKEKFFDFDHSSNIVKLLVEVQGTQFEGRNERIEDISINDEVNIKREPNNKYNNLNLAVLNNAGDSLGNLSADICNTLSPLIDSKIIVIDSAKVAYVEPLSKRSARCKKSLLTIKMQLYFEEPQLDNNNMSIVCILGGDQTRTWAQELSVIKCLIPMHEAKLLFEIYNRFNDEYNNDDMNYFGLDNLSDEVAYARQCMKSEQEKNLSYDKLYEEDYFLAYFKRIIKEENDRYGVLEKYIPSDEYIDEGFYSLKDIIYNNAIDEEKYYWFDQCRVSKEDYDFQSGGGFNHWYEVAELYRTDEKLPFDLNDEDIVSIFGFEKFEAFGDLSYGC